MNDLTVSRDVQRLADIGREAERMLNGHGNTYDVQVVREDGTVECSNLRRYFPGNEVRDAHLARVCRWLRDSGRGANIDRIELIAPVSCGVMVYMYWPQWPGKMQHAVRARA